MKSQMTIGKKLMLSFAVVLILTLAVGISSLSAIGHLGDELETAVNTTGRMTDQVGAVRSGFQEVAAQARYAHLAFVIRHLESRTQAGAANATGCGSCHSTAISGEVQETVDDGIIAVREQLVDLEALLPEQADRAALAKVEAGLDQWAPTFEEYLEFAQAGIGRLGTGACRCRPEPARGLRRWPRANVWQDGWHRVSQPGGL